MNRGFTLLELSIVLLIAGLIAAGIITGQNLIYSAQIRKLTASIDRYTSSVVLFKNRYRALPGDMKYATRLWGARAGGIADGIDATCQATFDATKTPKTATCNGNGNGQIWTTNWLEQWSAWQHLSNSGLVEGLYTGEGSGNGSAIEYRQALPGINCPTAGSYQDACFVFTYAGNVVAGGNYFFPGEYGHMLRIGRDADADDNFMLARDMYSLDVKMDDGFPGKGFVRAQKNFRRPECSSTDDADTALYMMNSTAVGCSVVVISGF